MAFSPFLRFSTGWRRIVEKRGSIDEILIMRQKPPVGEKSVQACTRSVRRASGLVQVG